MYIHCTYILTYLPKKIHPIAVLYDYIIYVYFIVTILFLSLLGIPMYNVHAYFAYSEMKICKQFKCIKCNCKVEYRIEYEISPFLMAMMSNNANNWTGILCFWILPA